VGLTLTNYVNHLPAILPNDACLLHAYAPTGDITSEQAISPLLSS